MKPETFMDILGELDDSLLTDAVKPHHRIWTRWVAVAAAVLLTVSAVLLLPHYLGDPFGEVIALPGDTSVTESDDPLDAVDQPDAPILSVQTTTTEDVMDGVPSTLATTVTDNTVSTTLPTSTDATVTETTVNKCTNGSTKAPTAVTTTKKNAPLCGAAKTTAKATTKAVTKVTAQQTTKLTTKATAKATLKTTAKATLKTTAKETIKTTTKKTTKVTKATTKATAKPNASVKGTTKTSTTTGNTPLGGTTATMPPTVSPPAVLTLAKAAYPNMPAYVSKKDANYTQEARKAWFDALQGLRRPLIGAKVDLTDFYGTTMESLLSEDNGKNKVFSPLNMYISLSMLAETTAGNSRTQLLNLLGVSDLSALRERNSLLWKGTYRDDGAVTCRLANSLWLDKRYTYNQSTLDTLAQDYYASSFSGEMGSTDYNTALQNWLNQQTDGLLKQQVAGETLDANTAVALASTISFRAKWNEAFKAENTVDGEFQTPNGRVPVAYMFAKEKHSKLYIADNFVACAKQVDDGYTMWFVLPKDSVTPEELAGDSLLQELLTTGKGVAQYYGQDYYGITLHLKVPKFDVADHADMTGSLKKLGVTDILNVDTADFSPLMDRNDLWLEEMNHAARVAVDEEGVTASAYTLTPVKLRGGVGEEIYELTLDRPFLFAVTGTARAMLFAGIVNKP